MRARSLAAAAAALFLSGCLGLGGPKAPDQLFTLTPSVSGPAEPRSAADAEAITVLRPSVPEALEARRIPVYVAPTAIQYLTEAQWVDYPAELFRIVLAETIAARTGRVVLDPAQYVRDPGIRVTGQLLRFGLDPARMEAVAVYEAAIDRPGGVATNRFEARVPVSAAEPGLVVPALNQAANQVAGQVAAWVSQ